jgi:Rrf2 family protein
MTLSQTAEYALRAVLYVAEHGRESPVRVGQIARALRVPQNYLSKTLHQLGRAGILASTRGKQGGFQLVRAPDRIPVLDVVALFDPGIENRQRCLLGRPQCSDRTACPAHYRWRAVGEQLAAFFRDTMIADLIETVPAPA